ncbi:MAG: acetate/propionate family kinase [Candidatus Doudnabacteria bacterium]
MKILVINAGSTSLKYKLFQIPSLNVLEEGNFQNIKSHEGALKQALRDIGDLRDIQAIGHRVVHGGIYFKKPVCVTEKVLQKLEDCSDLAPLHNPANLAGVRACQKYLPDIPNYACFDTAFFADLPKRAKIYALPWEFYKKQHIQRFGFHGLSHQYVAQEAAKRLKKPFEELKAITVHLGGGCSMTAIQKGKPIDTSMGFTPLEGLAMMTRAGDLDPGVILYLLKNHTKTELENILNHQSGLKGLAGYENYLNLLRAVQRGQKKACLAFENFIYHIQKYIGAYFAILNGIDALVFTGQIGAGEAITRNTICAGLEKILAGVKVMAIKTDEEKMIVKEIKKELARPLTLRQA